MKIKGLTVCVLAIVVAIASTSEVDAQLRGKVRSKIVSNQGSIYNGPDAAGMSTTHFQGFVRPTTTYRYAARNHFTPERVYTYSNRGLEAQRTHMWNQEEAACRSWHQDYQYWRWQEPTALVVPPTASYGTSYGWGVGQVRSTPIHSQYGRDGAGMSGGGGGAGASRTPYWPSSTDQFGIYPVRAPW